MWPWKRTPNKASSAGSTGKGAASTPSTPRASAATAEPNQKSSGAATPHVGSQGEGARSSRGSDRSSRAGNVPHFKHPNLRRLGPYVLTGRELGRGSNGVVHHAKHSTSGEEIAVKIMTQKRGQVVPREVAALRRIGSHPNITKLLAHKLHNGFHFIAMEAALGGELYQQVEKHGSLSEARARELMRGVVNGLVHMHSRGVVRANRDPPQDWEELCPERGAQRTPHRSSTHALSPAARWPTATPPHRHISGLAHSPSPPVSRRRQPRGCCGVRSRCTATSSWRISSSTPTAPRSASSTSASPTSTRLSGRAPAQRQGRPTPPSRRPRRPAGRRSLLCSTSSSRACAAPCRTPHQRCSPARRTTASSPTCARLSPRSLPPPPLPPLATPCHPLPPPATPCPRTAGVVARRLPLWAGGGLLPRRTSKGGRPPLRGADSLAGGGEAVGVRCHLRALRAREPPHSAAGQAPRRDAAGGAGAAQLDGAGRG
mmetsp:Transcript_15650/g.46757  ORF Transcript_15650/g.46757 Transcript_15650/m.46757 type:complete len:486 (+) Transcript_15650:85-1542(+)